MSRIVLPHNTHVIDYRKPMRVRSEDVVVEGGPDGSGPHRGVRWHMTTESYDRVMAMLACYNCVTTFPARPMKETLAIWKMSDFKHVRPTAVVNRLICEGRCPVCAVPINPEAIGIHGEGENPLNDRDD